MNVDVLFNVTSSLLSLNCVQSLLSVAESIYASAGPVISDAKQQFRSAFEFLEHISSPIHFEFTELQTTLLIVFLFVIGVNILLIGYYWSKYGGVITDRFIRPSEFFFVKTRLYRLFAHSLDACVTHILMA